MKEEEQKERMEEIILNKSSFVMISWFIDPLANR